MFGASTPSTPRPEKLGPVPIFKSSIGSATRALQHHRRQRKSFRDVFRKWVALADHVGAERARAIPNSFQVEVGRKAAGIAGEAGRRFFPRLRLCAFALTVFKKGFSPGQ
jgi:hypothetical protein